ncbi:MAG: stalk domain-containing protein, partial [Lachnospirales bacterium]
MRRLFVFFLILLISYNYCYCYANPDLDLDVSYYWYDGERYEDELQNARKKCIEYYHKTGEVLDYPAANDTYSGDYYLYGLDDAKNMGFYFCICGIDAIEYNNVVHNPDRNFIYSHCLYHMGINYNPVKSNYYDILRYNSYMPDEIDYSQVDINNEKWYNFLQDDMYKYYIDNDIIKLLEKSNMKTFLYNNGINSEVLDVMLIYSVSDWEYTLDNDPFIVAITDKGNYYITNLFENRASLELLLNDKSQIKNEHSNMVIYNQNEAIESLCSRKGCVFVNGKDYTDIINAEFKKDTVTVPLREFAESLGYKVEWIQGENFTKSKVILSNDKHKLSIKYEVWSDGGKYSLNVIDNREIDILRTGINTSDLYRY